MQINYTPKDMKKYNIFNNFYLLNLKYVCIHITESTI